MSGGNTNERIPHAKAKTFIANQMATIAAMTPTTVFKVSPEVGNELPISF